LRYFLMVRGRFEELHMADKRTTPEVAASASPRKREAPTIDLTATEVEPATAAGEPPPVPEQGAEGSQAASADNGGDSPSAPRESLNWLSANIKGPALAAGAAGAAIMTLVLLGLWLAGLLPIRDSSSTTVRAMDTQPIDALNGRIAKIEDSIAKLPPGDTSVNERMAAAENALKALGLTLTALNRRSDDIANSTTIARERAEAAEKAVTELRSSVHDAMKSASVGISSVELDALQRRIAGLEQLVPSAVKSSATDRPARLALGAAALRDVVVSGAPFAAALAQAKSLGADEKTLMPLEPFAATGVPTPAALAQELRTLWPVILKLSGAQAPEGGFLERLQANAGKLVRIRPVDAPPGDDASAVLARIELEAARNDIGGALNDLGKLPDAARAPAQAWIRQANERQAALTAARAYAVESARALAQQ
jgi:hypothetical protein